MTTTDQENLDAANRCLTTIRDGIADAQVRLPIAGSLDSLDALVGAEAAAASLREHLRALGAASPGLRSARQVLGLGQLDTLASRSLLSALRSALVAAQELDDERGHVDSDGHCTGWSEVIGGWVYSLAAEVEGAKGGGRE